MTADLFCAEKLLFLIHLVIVMDFFLYLTHNSLDNFPKHNRQKSHQG